MNNEIYLDNSSTTKVCDEAIKAIYTSLNENWGNPSSLHKRGIDSQNQLEKSREVIANYIAADIKDVYFTPGGTYSNNMAILGAATAMKRIGNRIITTQIEHPSVLNPIKELEKQGFEVIYLKPSKDGSISIEQVKQFINEKTCLISMMMVNNEIGSIFPVEKLKSLLSLKNPRGLVHIDAVQAFGKLQINVKKLKADFISFSSHKIHGPKGIGALYISPNAKIKPIIFGGGQGKSISPGTESIHLISGFAAAVLAIPKFNDQYAFIKELYNYAVQKLTAIPDITINSNPDASPFILNFSTGKIKSETMINYLSSNNIFVSGGSACSKGKQSYVLQAIDLPSDRINSAIRISFSRFSTKAEIDTLALFVNKALSEIKHF